MVERNFGIVRERANPFALTKARLLRMLVASCVGLALLAAAGCNSRRAEQTCERLADELYRARLEGDQQRIARILATDPHDGARALKLRSRVSERDRDYGLPSSRKSYFDSSIADSGPSKSSFCSVKIAFNVTYNGGRTATETVSCEIDGNGDRGRITDVELAD